MTPQSTAIRPNLQPLLGLPAMCNYLRAYTGNNPYLYETVMEGQAKRTAPNPQSL